MKRFQVKEPFCPDFHETRQTMKLRSRAFPVPVIVPVIHFFLS
jgi:hypothetical protein